MGSPHRTLLRAVSGHEDSVRGGETAVVLKARTGRRVTCWQLSQTLKQVRGLRARLTLYLRAHLRNVKTKEINRM